MNAPLIPAILARPGPADASDAAPTASADAVQYVWQSRFGPMLIEVRGGRVYVNGRVVEPA